MVNIRYAIAVTLMGFAIVPGRASAGALTSQFSVTARYQVACAIGGIDPVVFGSLPSGAVATPIVATSRLLVSCTSGTPFGVWIPANSSQRAMTSTGGAAINYNLFSNYSTKSPFPTSYVSTGYVAPSNTWVGTYNTANVNIFAEIPVGQTLTSGHYSDTIVVNVSY